MPEATAFMPDFTSQEILDGRFRLLELLGAGSFGKVYKAYDNRPQSPESTRYYAVKCLLKADSKSRECEMQLRELRLQKKVSHHPNIVTFCDAFEEGDFVFVILELCEGFDLFTAIVDVGLFEGNNQLIKSCYLKILDAVYYCHQKGVYHRDLKPENILCSKDGQNVWLADFGLSTNQRACRDFGCGSSAYISPECIGKETNNMVYSALPNDVWSLGVILVNLVTRHNPWSYAHSSDPCFDAFLKDRNSLREALPISEPLHRLLKRIFNLNPISRIAIPVLRKEILALETFYAEVSDADAAVKIIRVEVDVQVAVNSMGESTSSEGSPGCSIASPDELRTRVLRGEIPPIPKLFVVGSTSSSGSQDDQLLITPPHDPVELAIEVPEITDDSGSSFGSRALRRRPRFAVDPRISFRNAKLEVLPHLAQITQKLKDTTLSSFSI
jgi:serine/threonine protein kinase